MKPGDLTVEDTGTSRNGEQTFRVTVPRTGNVWRLYIGGMDTKDFSGKRESWYRWRVSGGGDRPPEMDRADVQPQSSQGMALEAARLYIVERERQG